MKLYTIYFVLCCFSSVLGLSPKYCSKNEDCNIEFSSCKNGLCVCDVGKVFSSTRDKCLNIAAGIGSSCQDTSQCTSIISGPSICDEKEICRCADDYVYFDDKCTKYQGFNESCTADTPCFDGIDLFALKCNGRKCVCNDGYYIRGEYGCRPSAKGKKECFFDIDCQDENQYCNYTLNSWGPLGECIDEPSIECSTDDDCQKELDNSYCSASRHYKCTCNDKFVYDKEKHKCIPIAYARINRIEYENKIFKSNLKADLDIECSTDNECENIKNSFCPLFRKKCTCKDNFIYDKNSGHCVKALGSTCDESETKCGIKHSICNNNNKCECPKYFIYSPYGEKCFKPTREFNLHSCGSNENCYSFGTNAICSKANDTSVTLTCNCAPGSTYNDIFQYCVSVKSETCKNNCKDKPHSTCISGQCVCDDHYVDDELKCLPDLGYTCSKSADDCIIDNAECLPDSKICNCMDGYFKHGNRECLKIIESLEDECELDIQCFKYLDDAGICVNKTCTCESSHILNQEEKCELLRSFGDQCTSKANCLTMPNTDHITCRNSQCVCEYDYRYDEKNYKCIADNGATAFGQQNIILCITVLLNTVLFFYSI